MSNNCNDCIVASQIEIRLDRIDESLKAMTELLTKQAVHSHILSIHEHMLSEHTQSLSAGRDRFNLLDSRLIRMEEHMGSIRSLKRWLVTTGVSTFIAAVGMLLNYAGKL